MKNVLLSFVLVLVMSGMVSADTFGVGGNQFDIDFVPISGNASSANGTNISQHSSSDSRYKTFTDPGDYRIGTYEITNDQWDKFTASLGVPVTGDPSNAYDQSARWTGTDVPTNNLAWYEGAQFVNYLNTSTGHQTAYKFTGTQGTGTYTLGVWESGDVGYDSSNPYRNSNAYYFLPTEDEWVKAAYWNGTSLQGYATIGDTRPRAGVDTNYNNALVQPWDVGSGSEELNGTFDMMGNVWEWMESPYYSGDYLSGSIRGLRGGSYRYNFNTLISLNRYDYYPNIELYMLGFRVASVPEPCTLFLLALGGLTIFKRSRCGAKV